VQLSNQRIRDTGNTMKKSFFLLLIVAFVSAASAQVVRADAQKAETEIPDFGSNWLKTPLSHQQTPNGDFNTRFYSRMVHLGGQTFQVGNVNYFKIPKVPGQKKFSYDEIGVALRDGMQMPFFIRDSGNAKVFEGEWQKMRRFVRLYVRENTDSVEYSFAIMRSSYGLPTATEAEVIQRELFKIAPDQMKGEWLKQITAKASVISDMFCSEAYAQSACNSSLAPTNYSACLACGGAVTQCCLINSSCGATGTTGTGSSPTISTSLGSISLDPTQYAGIQSDIGAMESLGQQAITDAQKEMAPGRLFLQAGATAAGAALGASLAGIAVNLMEQGAIALAEKFGLLKSKNDQARVEAFNAIRKQYVEEQKKVLEFEAGIDKALDAMNKGQAVETSEGMKFMGLKNSEILEKLGPEIEITNVKLDIAIGKLKKDIINSCVADQDADAADIVKVRKQLADYEIIKKNLNPSEATTCQKLSDSFRQLREAEGHLQSWRAEMAGYRSAVTKDMSKKNEIDQKSINQDAKISPKSVGNGIQKISDQDEARIGRQFDKEEDRLVDDCKKVIGKFLKQEKKENKSLAALTERGDKSKKVCEDYVKTPPGGVSMTNSQLAARFSPDVKDGLKEALDDAGILARVSELDQQKSINDAAGKDAEIQAASSRNIAQVTRTTENRSAAVSLGQVDSVAQFFDQLAIDQSGSHPGMDDPMAAIWKKKDQLRSECGGDWQDKELQLRESTDSVGRGDF
jgi:hypothetical protein